MKLRIVFGGQGGEELPQSLADLHDGMPETVGELAHRMKSNLWMFMEVYQLDLWCQRSRMKVSESLSLIQRPLAALPGGSPGPCSPPHRGPAISHHCHLATGVIQTCLSSESLLDCSSSYFSFATYHGKKPLHSKKAELY